MEALAIPPTPHVESWLSKRELLELVRADESRAAYQPRLAIWLTYLPHFPTCGMATLLGVWIPPCGAPHPETVGERHTTGVRRFGEQPDPVHSLTCRDGLNTIRLSSKY